MTTVGEPIEPEVWKWYHNTVGKGEAVIVDTWWQTETGGFLCSTVPGIHPMKPGSTGPAIPGIHPVIYDEDGKELASGSGKAGQHLHPQPLAWRVPDHLEGSGALRAPVLLPLLQGHEQQGLARLALHGG